MIIIFPKYPDNPELAVPLRKENIQKFKDTQNK